MNRPALPITRATDTAGSATDMMAVLSAVVAEQMSLMAEQRDLLARIDQLMTELVETRSDDDGGRARGSTVVTFTRPADEPPSCMEP